MNNCQVEYRPPSPEEESAIIELLKELIYNQKELTNSQNEGFSSLKDLLNELIELTEPSQPSAIIELLKESIYNQKELASSQNEGFSSLKDLLNELIELTEPSQPIIEKHFSTEETAISIATPNKPEGPDIIANAVTGTPGYDRIMIHNIMDRNSPHVSVINDGSSTLFVITSTNGNTWSAEENPILIGEARLFFNVYELRIRSPVAGNTTTLKGGVYRATEYDYSLAYSTNITPTLPTPNRSDFTAQSVRPINNLPLTTQLPPITVPNGFALVVRATVGNATVIYLANSAANLGIATNRIILNAGDTASLTITNANLVFVAGLGPGVNNVDILVEQ